MSRGHGEEEIVFRSLAAPGLEEDDLLLALEGLPVPGPFWGQSRPDRPCGAGPWDQAAERRRRHEELLDKWREHPAGGGASGP